MRSLASATFETKDLMLNGESGNLRQWHTTDGDLVSLTYFDKPPNINASLDDIEALRAGYRAVAAHAGGAALEIEVISVDDCRGVRLILKVPQAPAGMVYIGSLTLPFRDFSYVVRVQCAEGSLSGIRDTTILAELINTGEVKFDEDQTQPTGWWTDPYDPLVGGPPARNLSELPRYDARFPNHALSRLRRILPRVEATLRLAEDVKAEKRFGA
jgi:hypothetical protein